MEIEAKLTQGPVGRTLLGLSAPMMGGILGAIGFNLADTYFVSLLGTTELAAMSFTFPVVMVFLGLAFGMSTGTIAVVSQAIGRGEMDQVKRLASDSLLLAFLVVLVAVGVGMLTIDPLFRLLGATPETLPLIRDYMRIWYPGMVCLVVPVVANAAIKATGDTKIPALIIVGGTVTNLILDPILIFGWFGFPALGLKGAALATMIGRAGTMVVSLLILHYRERLLDFSPPSLKDVWRSWKAVGAIGVPATVTNLLEPMALGVITRLIAGYGPSAVAAWGAGSRITAFVLIPVFGVCSGLVPFIGQNWGAELFDRVSKARSYGYLFAVSWGIFLIGVLHLVAEPAARLFSNEAGVIKEIVRYLWIMPIGYAAFGILSVTEETLNAIGKPVIAFVQALVYMFVFYVPLGIAGAQMQAFTGLLWGLTAAEVLGGLVGLGLVRMMCRRGERACLEGKADLAEVPAG
ncbi:MAG: MATE family efflux transporter [bacterium]|nr:MATE family efflux transporter [bacterium]